MLKAIPDWWLNDGEEITVLNAPTHFGEVNMKVRGTPNGVDITFSGAERNKPEKIVIYLPKTRPVINKPEGIEVLIRTNQTKHWDMGVVTELYKKYWEEYGGKPRGVASMEKDF